MKMKFKGFVVLGLVVLALGASAALAADEAGKEKQRASSRQLVEFKSSDKSGITINRGRDEEVCQVIHKLFDVPENKGYLWTNEEFKARGANAAVVEETKGRQLIIPRVGAFKDLQSPDWADVDTDTAWRLFPKYLAKMASHKDTKNLVFGKDFKIQKTEIDIDGDGTKEAVYRRFGNIYSNLMRDEPTAEKDWFAHQANDREPYYTSAQLVLFKGWPFVLLHSDIFSLSARRYAFWEMDKKMSIAGLPLECQLSAAFKGRLD